MIHGAAGKAGRPRPRESPRKSPRGGEAPKGWVMPGSRGGSGQGFLGPVANRVRPQGRQTSCPVTGEELIRFYTTG